MRHLRHFFAATLSITAFFILAESASAQSPSQQFGLGAGVSGSTTAGLSTVSSGVHFAYAISPAFHIGAGFGFSSLTLNKTTVSSFELSPYAKFLFMGPNASLKPFIQGGIGYRSLESSSTTDFGFGGGGEYFVNRNLGIFAGVTLFGFNISDEDGGFTPFDSGFGILSASIGAEWFF